MPGKESAREAVARLLQQDVQRVEWSQDRFGSGMDRASKVYRLTGTAEDKGRHIPWSLVLKVVRPLPGREDPVDLYYWLREPLALRSGHLAELGPGLRAVRCLLVEQSPEACHMWLEDVAGLLGRQWPSDRPERADQAIYRLGAFNGRALAGGHDPHDAWLTRRFRRAQMDEAGPGMELLARSADDPLVALGWADGAYEATLGLWEERERLLAAYEALPAGLRHGDATDLNLFACEGSDGEEFVAIDWAWVGLGPVAEDLVPAAMRFAERFAAPADQPGFAERLFAQYVDGLRAGGWRGDERLARVGYALGTALRYLFHPEGLRLLDPDGRLWWERYAGASADVLVRRLVVPRVARALALAREAQGLMGLL